MQKANIARKSASRLASAFSLAALAALPALSLPGATASAQEIAGDVGKIPSGIFEDAALKKLTQQLVDGENVVIGTVDDEPITYESVRAEFGPQIESRMNAKKLAIATGVDPYMAGASPREIELAVLYEFAASKALQLILDREAKASEITISDAQIDSYLAGEKERAGVDPEDQEAWARYTLQRYSQPPLAYREKQRLAVLRQQAMYLMAGVFGPIRGLKLPVFIPLGVTPAEIREAYLRTRDQWRVTKDIEYTVIGVEIPNALMDNIQLQQKIEQALNNARKMLKDEGAARAHSYVQAEITTITSGLDSAPPVVRAVETKKVADDSQLDSIGRSVRSLDKGAVSTVGRDYTNSHMSVAYITKLDSKNEQTDTTRAYTDPVVQRQLRELIREQRRENNLARVQAALIKRAIILPRSLARMLNLEVE